MSSRTNTYLQSALLFSFVKIKGVGRQRENSGVDVNEQGGERKGKGPERKRGTTYADVFNM